MSMSVFGELARRAATGETCVLATVIATEGSSPAQSAMKMLVGDAGRLVGTIGGGRVEATVLEAARDCLGGGKARVLAFTLDDEMADEGGMICGGTVRILVERVAPPAEWAAQADTCSRTGRPAALLATFGESVDRRLVVGTEAEPYLLADESPRIEGESLFVEPLFRPRCIILGAGHVGRAVSRVASEAGFFVAIVEDREDQAARAEADETICADLVDGFTRLDAGPHDHVLILTRSHGLDRRCAREALLSPARYVGMLASRRKAAAIREALDAEGVDAARLSTPVGLDIGAVSAGEIAVSVVAQMIRVKRTGRGGR